MVTEDQIDTCSRLLREMGVTRLVVFGSAATSPATARDLDLACLGLPPHFFYSALGRLNEIVECEVDLFDLASSATARVHIERFGRVIF